MNQPLRIHFIDSDGLHMCTAKVGFLSELLKTRILEDVTCEACRKGKMSRTWKHKYEQNENRRKRHALKPAFDIAKERVRK